MCVRKSKERKTLAHMCVILHLAAGVMIPYPKLENAVFNNWHSFGLILKDNDRMEVIKRCHQRGNDPSEIYSLLEDNKDIERVLHLRYNTHGLTNLDNAHPFNVFYTDRRRVEFMHNGTLFEYKNGPQGHSDTRNFADEILRPMLSGWVGENGKADYQSDFIKKTINKYWSQGSKGILIANDIDPYFINRTAWSELPGEKSGTTFLASNNEYFNAVTRGPEHEARRRRQEEANRRRAQEEAARRQEEAEATYPVAVCDWPLHQITNLKAGVNRDIMANLADLWSDPELYNDEGLARLSSLTGEEVENFVEKHPMEASHLFMYITSEYNRLYNAYTTNAEELIDVRRKHSNATKRIATLVHANKNGTEIVCN